MKMSGFLADRSLQQSRQIYFDRVFERRRQEASL